MNLQETTKKALNDLFRVEKLKQDGFDKKSLDQGLNFFGELKKTRLKIEDNVFIPQEEKQIYLNLFKTMLTWFLQKISSEDTSQEVDPKKIRALNTLIKTYLKSLPTELTQKDVNKFLSLESNNKNWYHSFNMNDPVKLVDISTLERGGFGYYSPFNDSIYLPAFEMSINKETYDEYRKSACLVTTSGNLLTTIFVVNLLKAVTLPNILLEPYYKLERRYYEKNL